MNPSKPAPPRRSADVLPEVVFTPTNDNAAAALVEDRCAVRCCHLQLWLEYQLVVLRATASCRPGVDEERRHHPVAVQAADAAANNDVGLAWVRGHRGDVALDQQHVQSLATHWVPLPDHLGVARCGGDRLALLLSVTAPTRRAGFSYGAGQPDVRGRQRVHWQRLVVCTAIFHRARSVRRQRIRLGRADDAVPGRKLTDEIPVLNPSLVDLFGAGPAAGPSRSVTTKSSSSACTVVGFGTAAVRGAVGLAD